MSAYNVCAAIVPGVDVAIVTVDSVLGSAVVVVTRAIVVGFVVAGYLIYARKEKGGYKKCEQQRKELRSCSHWFIGTWVGGGATWKAKSYPPPFC